MSDTNIPVVSPDFTQDGNSFFDNVYIAGELYYDFKDLTFENLNITGISTFGDLHVTKNFIGVSIDLTKNINVAGIGTFKDIHVIEKIFAGSSKSFGSSGQVLSSTGSEIEWINTSSANVGSATSVGINLENANAPRFLTFVEKTSGNDTIRIDSDLKYNPGLATFLGITTFQSINTGLLNITGVTTIGAALHDGSGSAGASGEILSSTGSGIDWIAANTTNVGSATSVGITNENTNATRFLTFVERTSGNDTIRVDATTGPLSYNPSSGVLNVAGNINAASFVRSGGTSSQFLKADGTVDSNTYLQSESDTTYDLICIQTSGSNNNPKIKLDASAGDDDEIQITGGTNITVTRNNDSQLTIDNTFSQSTPTLDNVCDQGNTTDQNIETTGTLSDAAGNVRELVNNGKSSGYTLTANDVGELINTNSGVTVPTGVFSAGQAVTIYNNTSGNITITQAGGATVFLAGSSTSGNRTLAQRGVATVLCVSSNTFTILGGGLS